MQEHPEKIILPILPLKDIVIFPNSIMPLFVIRSSSMAALDDALASDKMIFIAAQKSQEIDIPAQKDIYTTGTVAEVLQILKVPDGTAKILVEGLYIGRIIDFVNNEKFMQGLIEKVRMEKSSGKRLNAVMRLALRLFERYAKLSDKIPEDLYLTIKNIDDPLVCVNTIANYASFKIKDKQDLLENLDIEKKYYHLIQLLESEIELLEIENKILTQVKSSIGRSQKELYLNEQLKVIEKELGLATEEDIEIEEFHDKIAKIQMPKETKEKARKELSRLAKMAPLSPEATVSRTYIEWLIEMPWGIVTQDKLDIGQAQKTLDEDHYGLAKVKERIIEYLAVHSLVKKIKGTILCFVGPPGVGKTSLARSIARSLGRKFVRVSLGGVRDEAEIRGHRRTYIGSLPGKIIQSIKKAGSMNPVFLLDEVDKMSSDFRGDPASALLEVLDPEQNHTFNDHYLEIDFDLSQVLFITTANTTDGIPHALIDRMEIIRLPGYTQEEKLNIAKEFLIQKQIKANGLTKKQIVFPDDGIKMIIENYTKEAGVRNLEREIAAVCRKVAKAVLENGQNIKKMITAETVRELLGPIRYSDIPLSRGSEIGVATGLAWTEFGGEILPAETTIMKGKGNLVLTGKLGEVMQESAKTALSFIRSHSKEFKLEDDFYKDIDIHVHLPEGAIPKDGPSAGITIATSMVSALGNIMVRQDVAMTGEITLRGKVLKIGGLKEKILAAHRAHIKEIILPDENMDEVEEIPKDVRDEIKLNPVKQLSEVFEIALRRA